MFNLKSLEPRALSGWKTPAGAAAFALAALLALCETALGYSSSDSPFGINGHIYGESEAAGMEAMGVKWTRCDFNWDIIEAGGKGQYSWSLFDDLVTAAHDHGLNVLAILGYSPPWATTAPEGAEDPAHYPPEDFDDYRDFVRAVVERYDGDGVDDMPGSLTVPAFELWNEPDIGFCNCEPEVYAQMLTAGYVGARSADPDVLVLMGGLSRGGKDGDFTDRMIDYLQEATSTVPFDVINNHSYQEPSAQPGLIQRHRFSFTSRGIDLPYWFTEGSTSVDQPDEEPEQAEAVLKKYVWYLANGVEKFFWYMWQYSADDYGEGFFYPNGSRKQGYYAYQTAASLIQPREYDSSLAAIATEYERHGFRDATKATGTLYVLWSADGATRTVSLSFPAPSLDRITYAGASKRISPASGNVYDIELDSMPVFLVEADLNLNGPPVRSPAAESIVADDRPRVEWDAFTGAQSYILQLSRNPEFPQGSTLEYSPIFGTNYLLNDPLDEGKWHARAIAVKTGVQTYGPTTPFTVDLTAPDPPSVSSVDPSGISFGGAITIGFDDLPDSDAVTYNIYRSETLAGLGSFVYSTARTLDPVFTDRLGEGIADKVYYYHVTALDSASPPNESAPSDVYQIFFKVRSTLDSGWNLMSFPGDPPERAAYSPVANFLSGFRWDGGLYEAYDGDIYKLDYKKPYWIHNTTLPAGELTASGPVLNPETSVDFSLSNGWNLVPNPFPMPLPWVDDPDGIAFVPSAGGPSVGLAYASSNGMIGTDVYYYEEGRYKRASEAPGQAVPPFRAFWIKAHEGLTMTLPLPH